MALIKKQWQKHKSDLFRVGVVSFCTLIYGIGLSWFLLQVAFTEAGLEGVRIYAGGIPGIAQLFVDFIEALGPTLNHELFISVFIFVANIPVLLLGWFGVSKKFTFFSLVSVILQSTVVGLIPVPNWDFIKMDPITLSVVGGLLVGLGVGGALRFGTSTGGFDIVAQYFAFKYGKSVGFISTIINVSTSFLGAIVLGFTFGGYAAIATLTYTIIRLLISMIAIDKIHTAYQFVGVEIITNDPKDMIQNIFDVINRGVTVFRVEGGFSKVEKKLLYVVISSYELNALVSLIKKTDNEAFIVTFPLKNVYGTFKRKTIA